MDAYTFTGEGLFKGINKDIGIDEGRQGFGNGLRKNFYLSKENPPTCHETDTWIITSASVTKTAGRILFEKSKPEQSGILVYVKTSVTNPTCDGMCGPLEDWPAGKTIKKATVHRVPTGNMAIDVYVWMEELIILQPGQGIMLRDQSDRKRSLVLKQDGTLVDSQTN